MKKIFSVMLTLLIIVLILFLILGLCFSIYVSITTEKEINEEIFEVLSENSSSKIYYYETQSDKEAGIAVELTNQEIFGGYRSIPLKYNEIPKNLINAFISVEDKRFFKHSGVDWKRTIGASANFFLNFKNEFGGSTITQQLIKNITEKDDVSFQRKIQEILWALDLETKMSKEEILEKYLNIINLSNGCYGIGAASKYYFSKNVEELSLLECASIAAITNNPSYYDPIRNPNNNRKRAEMILRLMREQEYISQSEYESALLERIQINVSNSKKSQINTWYVDMVLDDVINDLIVQKGYTRTMANILIYTGGLKIYTAMDLEIQQILEKYYANGNNFAWSNNAENPQSAMIIIDPYSGDILGIAGAVGNKSGNRLQNFATDTVRPAGSVIKPLSVYAPAIDKGLVTWSTVYDDTPVKFESESGNLIAWPKNANGNYRGLTNVNYAIEQSINTVTVKVLEDLTLEESFDFLQNKLNMSNLIESKKRADGTTISDKDYAALALGQLNYGLSLEDITSAYSIFVNNGIYTKSRSYYKVTDVNGNTIIENKYSGQAVMSEECAMIMTKMLQNVTENGTAKSIILKNKIECAGKTGTTQKNQDRWYIGYTPYLVGGVWYGYEYPKSLSGTSSNICIKIWDEIMTVVHKKYTSASTRKFEISDKIVTAEFCKDSGLLMTEACKKDPRGSRAEIGYFIAGSEPNKECNCHVLVRYDTATKGVATFDCDSQNKIYVGLINVNRSFPKQIYITDAQYVWRNIGNNVLPETNPNLPFFNNLLKEGEFSGISKGNIQYNRFCREHFNYVKWLEKQQE